MLTIIYTSIFPSILNSYKIGSYLFHLPDAWPQVRKQSLLRKSGICKYSVVGVASVISMLLAFFVAFHASKRVFQDQILQYPQTLNVRFASGGSRESPLRRWQPFS
jgi:hypothetical protein